VKKVTKVVGILIAAGAVSMIVTGPAAADINPVKLYAVPVGKEYEIRPLLSASDTVPETGNPGKEYRMVGISDGLGAERHGDDVTVYMNHEFGNTTQSGPLVGGPANRGAIVSKLELDGDGTVRSGERLLLRHDRWEQGSGNELGRLYHLRLNQGDPTGPAPLEIVYNADAVIADGGDVAVSPTTSTSVRTSSW
jgi:hypothetical protein